MSIEFALEGLHPSYERVVRDVIRGLDADYPVGAVQKVELFEKAGDESMGCSPQPGVIRLNKRWFGRPIDELREAARTDDLIFVGGFSPPIPWHGGMEEPLHLLSHEFFHCLQDKIPGWREFIEPHWQQACADPVNCRPPSGYCLATADEFWADSGAAMRLNYKGAVTGAMREFLENAIG